MIGERLKSERERLGLTQPEFAETAGAKKRTLIDWEKGVSSPTAVQLAALAAAGVDVLYVLTGQRALESSALSPEQQALLAKYAAADDVGRKMAHRVLSPTPDQEALVKKSGKGSKAA